MPRFIIKTVEGKELTIEAENVKLDILSHQHTSMTGRQVIALDEPIGTLIIEKKGSK